MKKHYTRVLISLGLSTTLAPAAISTLLTNSPIPITVPTNGSASYSITGFGSSSGDTENYRFGGSNDANGYLTADYTVSSTGGPLTIGHSSVDNVGGNDWVRGFEVTMGAGVTSFTYKTTFDRYLHGMRLSSQRDDRPLLTGLRYANPLGTPDYDLKLEYSDISTIIPASGSDQSIANGTVIQGLPSTDVSDYHFNFMPNTLPTATGNTSFVTINGSASTPTVEINSSESGDESWIGLHTMRFLNSTTGSASHVGNLDGDTLIDGDIERIQQINARTLEITITSDNGGPFEEGAAFFFSHSGRQEVALQEALVPEPSSILLLTLGGLASLSRRRKRIIY